MRIDVSYEDLILPRLGGSYNTIIQKNTCAFDNIPTILRIFKENITKSYPVIGITSTKAKLYPFMSLLSEYDLDQLRNIIANEIRLQTTREHFNEIYDFLCSRGTLIKYGMSSIY